MNSKQTDYANMMNVNREPPKGDMHLWTMRDEYAKAALISLITEGNGYNHLVSQQKPTCEIAYQWADAMMKAREVWKGYAMRDMFFGLVLILCSLVSVVGLVVWAAGFYTKGEGHFERTAREFSEACTAVNGKATWNGRNWECLK